MDGTVVYIKTIGYLPGISYNKGVKRHKQWNACTKTFSIYSPCYFNYRFAKYTSNIEYFLSYISPQSDE